MANIASQIKRNRQALVARQRNKAVRSQLKSSVRQFRTAAEAGDRATAETAFATASRNLDKAAQKGVVHRNFAANRKSAMAKTLAGL